MLCTLGSKVRVHDLWFTTLIPEGADAEEIRQIALVTRSEPPADTYEVHIQRVVPA